MKRLLPIVLGTVIAGLSSAAEEPFSYDLYMNGRYLFSLAFQPDKVLTKGWGGSDDACKKEGMAVPLNTADVGHPHGQFSMVTTHSSDGQMHRFKMESINLEPKKTLAVDEFTFRPGATCAVLSWQYSRFQFPSGDPAGVYDMTKRLECRTLPFDAFAKPKVKTDGSRC
jgi:hypothetical protein